MQDDQNSDEQDSDSDTDDKDETVENQNKPIPTNDDCYSREEVIMSKADYDEVEAEYKIIREQ